MNGNREALGTMLRGTFHTFDEEEEITHLLPQNTAGTARVQRDR